jgi:hypothetical protein
MRRTVLFGCWCAAALGACTPLGVWLYEDPAFKVSGVRVQRDLPTDSTVLVALAVLNPNAYELTTTRFELELKVNGHKAGRYARDSIIPVGQTTTDTLSLPFFPPAKLDPELEALRPGTHRVEVEGSAVLTTPIGERRIRIAHAGDLALSSAAADGAGRSEARTDDRLAGGGGGDSAPAVQLPKRRRRY